uniref:(northern house mosquito) hypothetical protein n=1 Tax=Culex pipiens TaxID=7175 RepID=A0A8D8BS98_CULPI
MGNLLSSAMMTGAGFLSGDVLVGEWPFCELGDLRFGMNVPVLLGLPGTSEFRLPDEFRLVLRGFSCRFDLRTSGRAGLGSEPLILAFKLRLDTDPEFILLRKLILSTGFSLDWKPSVGILLAFRKPIPRSFTGTCFLEAFLIAGDCLLISAMISDSCSRNSPSFFFGVTFTGVPPFDLVM